MWAQGLSRTLPLSTQWPSECPNPAQERIRRFKESRKRPMPHAPTWPVVPVSAGGAR
jgi:hypothetical protein